MAIGKDAGVVPQFEFPCELRGCPSANFAVKSSSPGGKNLSRKEREERPQSTQKFKLRHHRTLGSISLKFG
jgi:hypothetical protein